MIHSSQHPLLVILLLTDGSQVPYTDRKVFLAGLTRTITSLRLHKQSIKQSTKNKNQKCENILPSLCWSMGPGVISPMECRPCALRSTLAATAHTESILQRKISRDSQTAEISALIVTSTSITTTSSSSRRERPAACSHHDHVRELEKEEEDSGTRPYPRTWKGGGKLGYPKEEEDSGNLGDLGDKFKRGFY